MAIYNNREVAVVGPMPMAGAVESITVQYRDGSHENVKLGLVKFTEDEKQDLVKRYPSRYENIDTISDEDLKAVRIGVAPPSDPSIKEQAAVQARREAQAKMTAEINEKAKKEADANLAKEVSAINSADGVKTGSATQMYQKASDQDTKSPAQKKVENKAGKAQ